MPRPEAGSFLFFAYFLLIPSQLLAKLFPLNFFAPRPSFRCSSFSNPSLIHVPDKIISRKFHFLNVMQNFMDMLIRASEFYHLFDLELVRIKKVCWSTHFPLTLFFLFRFVLPCINAAILPGLNPADCFLLLLKLYFPLFMLAPFLNSTMLSNSSHIRLSVSLFLIRFSLS